MNCAEFWNTAPQWSKDAGVEHAGHLAECPLCAVRWEHEQALTAALRLVAGELRSVEAPHRVEAGLTAAFRARAGLRRRRAARHAWWPPVVAWAAAAAATVALAMVLIQSGQPVAVSPRPAASPNRKAPPIPQWAAAPLYGGTGTDSDSSILESDFIPLPNATQIQPYENVNVVRVEVPRSAMIAMGISVSADDAPESVLADVVFGPDGTARAVRVVNDGSSLEEE